MKKIKNKQNKIKFPDILRLYKITHLFIISYYKVAHFYNSCIQQSYTKLYDFGKSDYANANFGKSY